MNIIQTLRVTFLQTLADLYGTATPDIYQMVTFDLNVDDARQQFGDISTNAAMVIAKRCAQQPREVATTIISHCKHPAIGRIEVAGPGFLNFFLTQDAFNQLAADLMAREDRFFTLDDSAIRLNYNIEFVSANPTGPLHLGHGRGGIIGDVLGNVLLFLGHSVVREYYINDAGNQMQKLGQSLKVRCQQEAGLNMAFPDDGYGGSYLVDVAKSCIAQYGTAVIGESDQFFIAYASQQLLASIKASLKEYGIRYDVWFSEKSLHNNGSITKTLALLQEKGHVFLNEGALWFRATSFGDDKDRVLRKASGEYTYVAADAAYLQNKADRGFDVLIMVLGHDHHGYVDRLQGLRKALGCHHLRLETILYQLVHMKHDGQHVRMSKRAGNIVTLTDVIETVGVDVARFFYLNRKADAHLEFDLTLALKKTEENPVYYIQYALCRTHSILQKAASLGFSAHPTALDSRSLGSAERVLIKKIVDLTTVLTAIAHKYQTHMLAQYAIELATTFHRYYAAYRILDPEHPEQTQGRLLMVHLTGATLRLVLQLLNISQPASM